MPRASHSHRPAHPLGKELGQEGLISLKEHPAFLPRSCSGSCHSNCRRAALTLLRWGSVFGESQRSAHTENSLLTSFPRDDGPDAFLPSESSGLRSRVAGTPVMRPGSQSFTTSGNPNPRHHAVCFSSNSLQRLRFCFCRNLLYVRKKWLPPTPQHTPRFVSAEGPIRTATVDSQSEH